MTAARTARVAFAAALGLLLASLSVVVAQAAPGPSGGVVPGAPEGADGGKPKTVVPADECPSSADVPEDGADATIPTDPIGGLSDATGAAP
ncbi:MAG: hypothetical protein ACKORA_06905, partial [Solirubrobacterales bacterium]